MMVILLYVTLSESLQRYENRLDGFCVGFAPEVPLLSPEVEFLPLGVVIVIIICRVLAWKWCSDEL
jgi:hypothetical protein